MQNSSKKTSAPLSVKKNNYNKNPKNSTVYTPIPLSEFIYLIVKKHFDENIVNNRVILDPSVGSGNLLYPYREHINHLIGIDIKDQDNKFWHHITKDFLEIKEWENLKISRPDIAIINPPFNNEFNGKRKARKLIPELFFDKIVQLFGSSFPFVMIVPMGFRLNQRIISKRFRSVRDSGVEITSIISLPLDIFSGVEFHCEVLCFNMDHLKSHYFLEDNILF